MVFERRIIRFCQRKETLPPTPVVFRVPGSAPFLVQAELKRERIVAKSAW